MLNELKMNFNKRELKMIKKASEQLQEVQKSCSARLFDQKDIEETIKEAKKAFNRLDPIERKWLKQLIAINEYTIPVCYKYPAKTSVIKVILNKYGTLEKINVSRERADKEPYGGGSSIKIKMKYE